MAKKKARNQPVGATEADVGPSPSHSLSGKKRLSWCSGLIVFVFLVFVLKVARSAVWVSPMANKKSEKTSDVDELATIRQPPHPIRQGHSESLDSIRANHQLLDRYNGDLLPFEVLETFPHNKSLFTQGLLFADGYLYEGTGLNGRTEVLQIEPATGKAVRRSIILDKEHFGEGLALVPAPATTSGDSSAKDALLVQITYKHRKGFIYRAHDLTGPIREFEYDTVTGQGWGLAFDHSRRELVVSDGSEYLFIWDADSLVEKRHLRVTLPVLPQGEELGIAVEENSAPKGTVYLKYINELEVLPGGRFVLANVWYDDRVVLIDLFSGLVVAAYDFRKLRPRRKRGEDCFNGIALDENTGDLYVTGKKWSNLYRVRLPGLRAYFS
mmetsp:Transcript_16356/g.32594  ORF Transcript_16356/g.32594 Transcript_16356/m.32594 type:complete len:383 (-) Transcript_16356:88-1236(-)